MNPQMMVNPFGLNFLESLQIILVMITLALLIYFIWKIGQGTLRTAFIHFIFGTALIGDSQFLLIFHPFFSFGVQTLWHIMFFLGLLSFLWGGIRLKQTSYNSMAGSYTTLDFLVTLVLVGLAAGSVLASASALTARLESFMSGSIIEAYSLHHFFITMLAVISGVYIATLERTWRRLLHINIYPIIVFIFLMCLQHVLEIVGHINMEMETILEITSQLIAIAAFLVFDWGLVQLISSMNRKR